MSPRKAGIEGSKEIFFAVVSTTVTLIAVFLPIVFMEGMTGRLFREFSVVIAGAVAFSSLVALTFTPMLATKLLKRRDTKSWLYAKTEPFFQGMITGYMRMLKAFMKIKWVALVLVVVFFGVIAWFWNAIPSELSPGRPFTVCKSG